MRWKTRFLRGRNGAAGQQRRLCRRLHASAPPKSHFFILPDKNDGGWTQAFDEARRRSNRRSAEDPVRGERAGSGRQDQAGRRRLHRARLQRHHRHGLRLFRHVQGAVREISESRVPQCIGHDQRAESRVLLRPHLREPVSLRHGRRRDVEDRQARLCRRASDRSGQLDHQCLRTRRSEDQSEGDRDGDLHRRLERSGQGARRRLRAGRSGHRRHRPARRHADAADRRPGARHLRHRPSSRSARVRAQGDAVLVGLDLGQVPRLRSSRRSRPATGSPARTAHSRASRTAAPTSRAAAPRCRRRSSTR